MRRNKQNFVILYKFKYRLDKKGSYQFKCLDKVKEVLTKCKNESKNNISLRFISKRPYSVH